MNTSDFYKLVMESFIRTRVYVQIPTAKPVTVNLIRRSEDVKAIDYVGDDVPCYDLVVKGAPADKLSAVKVDSFTAYVCNYRTGKTINQVLGKSADFMFTMTMDGCSFGIGIPGKDGTVMVSHSNAKGHGSDEENHLAQQKQLIEVFDKNPFTQMLEPSNYRKGGDGTSITTFGMRENGEWKFYFQKWKKLSSRKFQTSGVEPID